MGITPVTTTALVTWRRQTVYANQKPIERKAKVL